jgi:hypothetical protein
LQDLIPIQDATSKTLIDLLAAADATGFPEKVFESEAHVIPPTGIKFGPGGLLWGGKWYNLQPGDLNPLMTLFERMVMTMAQISRTPLQYYQITGQVASDDTQRAGDTGLVSKIENRAVSFGNTWEDVMKYGRKLHNVFSTGPQLDEKLSISTEWDSFERVDAQMAEKVTAETQGVKATTYNTLTMLFPFADPRELARLSGYTEDEADKIAEFAPKTRVTGIEL